MFTVLNRLRGTKAYFAKIAGAIIALVFYITTKDIYTSLFLGVAYVAGESMGWGKWIGGIFRGSVTPTLSDLEDREGERNGIHYLANKIAPEKENYYRYCFTALSIRGMYWIGISILPLLLFGYISILFYFTATLLLGFGFPLSVELGKITTTRFNFSYKYFGFNGFWEHSEVWYGLIQDALLIAIILSLV